MVFMAKLENIQGVQIGAVIFRDPLTGEYENTSHKLYLEAKAEEAEKYSVEISEDIQRLLARKYKEYMDVQKSLSISEQSSDTT